MYNSGFECSVIDGTELKYENEKFIVSLRHAVAPAASPAESTMYRC